jgi:hypothetical protein
LLIAELDSRAWLAKTASLLSAGSENPQDSDADDCGDLCAHASCAAEVDPAIGATSSLACRTGWRVHSGAGEEGTGCDRRVLHGDDRAFGEFAAGAEFISRKAGEVFAGWMGAGVARRTDDGGLHDHARGAPPRTGLHARASAWVSSAGGGDISDVEVGRSERQLLAPSS